MHRIAKYLSTGGVGLVVNLGTYRLLVAYGGVHFLTGSIIALSCSTVVGFLLQKFWTFGDWEILHAPRQFLLYVGLALTNLGLNTVVVYMLVTFAKTHYLLAQACGAGIVACMSFFVYRHIIFSVAQKIPTEQRQEL